MHNVCDGCVQLRSRARSTFPDVGVISAIDVVGFHGPDRLTGVDPLFGQLF
jgi:hypothetical protein